MRIVAGKYRSRVLKSLRSLPLRPTSDKLRETLFNILGAAVEGSVFVHVYAGTGAVGIKALSRGAAEVIFIEKHEGAASLIRRNLESLGVRDFASILAADALLGLEMLAHPRVPRSFHAGSSRGTRHCGASRERGVTWTLRSARMRSRGGAGRRRAQLLPFRARGLKSYFGGGFLNRSFKMRVPQLALGFVTSALSLVVPQHAASQNVAAQGPPYGRPDATIDLRTREGAELVKGVWRYSDVKIVEADFRAPGPDLKPSGKPIKTYDYTPHAGAADFDDPKWEALDPTTLEARRSGGKLCFNWYRINITIPAKVGEFEVRGSTVDFEIVIDDYAEVWVDGKLSAVYGQSGSSVIKGYNAPNRVIIAHNVAPGQEIQLAVFGINGPISASPNNFIWVKSAVLDFYKVGRGNGIEQVETQVIRLDAIRAPGTKIEKLAAGFLFTEGPVWDREGSYLLFSDPQNDLIYRWTQDGEVSVYRTHSGYTGTNIGEYGQPGSNGLTFYNQGRLTINEHGNRRVTRLEKNGVLTVLADRYEGKRLNSPNDLVYRSDGALYFTDPPFGLPGFFDDPRKELPYSGVFCLINRQLKLVSTDLSGPNGLAFSPDEKYLYVDNWDLKKKTIMRYEVQPEGTLLNGKVFFDATDEPGEDAWDGMKVDQLGNLYLSGPGGLWIVSPAGKHLGTIIGPEHPHNMAWGDEDGKTLYMCAQTGLYRIRFNVPGIRP